MVVAPHSARRPEAGLHLVEGEIDAVAVGQLRETPEERRQGNPLAARALDRLDDDRDDLLRHQAENALDLVQGLSRLDLVLLHATVAVVGRKRQLEIAGAAQAVKVLGRDRIDRLGHAEGEDGATVERLVEVHEAARSMAPALRVVQGDKVLHHVFDRLGAAVDGVDLQTVVAHRLRRESVEHAVVGEALWSEEVGIRDLVVRRADEALDVGGLVEAGMVVADEL